MKINENLLEVIEVAKTNGMQAFYKKFSSDFINRKFNQARKNAINQK